MEELKVTVEEPSAVTRSITVEVPAAEVAGRFERVLRDYRRKAVQPGFRKGKVPADVIRKLYWGDVTADVARGLIGDTFEAARRQGRDRTDRRAGVRDHDPRGEPAVHVRREGRGPAALRARRLRRHRGRGRDDRGQGRGTRAPARRGPPEPRHREEGRRGARAARRRRRGHHLRGHGRRRADPGRLGQGLPGDARQQHVPAGLRGQPDRRGRPGRPASSRSASPSSSATRRWPARRRCSR